MCYQVRRDATTFATASRLCRVQGSRMASPDDMEDWDAIAAAATEGEEGEPMDLWTGIVLYRALRKF